MVDNNNTLKIDNQLYMGKCNATSCTDDVATNEEIELISYTMSEVDDEEWEVIEAGDEASEDNVDEVDEQQVHQTRDLIPRVGPQVQDYLNEFFIYIRNRTIFRRSSLIAPIELQRTMERMETARVPMSIWRAFINASINLISKIGVQFDTHTFLDVLIFILTIVSEFFIHNIILQIVVLIINCIGTEQLCEIITIIYDFIKLYSQRFVRYVKEKFEDYSKLSTEHFKKYMRPKNN